MSMRRCVLTVLLLAVCSSFAAAQVEQTIFEVPNSELYFGYTWQHAGLDGSQAPTQGLITQNTASLKGFTVGYAHYFLKNIGFTAEISRVTNGALDPTGISYTRTSYVGGPTLRLHRYGFFSPAVHVMAGVDHATFKVPIGGSVLNFADTDIAILGGGVLDGNLSKHLGVRLAEVDYLYTNHYGQAQSSFRYVGGVVIRF